VSLGQGPLSCEDQSFGLSCPRDVAGCPVEKQSCAGLQLFLMAMICYNLGNAVKVVCGGALGCFGGLHYS
jgi:hypothetical protein